MLHSTQTGNAQLIVYCLSKVPSRICLLLAPFLASFLVPLLSRVADVCHSGQAES